MSEWPVGISTGCFYRTPILNCLEPIRASGFAMIEVCSFPAHLDYHNAAAVREAAERIRQLDLEAYSLHAPFADGIDITSFDEGQRNGSIEEILRAAEAAATLKTRYFVIHPGPEHGWFAEGERFRRMENAARSLNRISHACKEMGVGLILENMLPHLTIGQVRDLLWVLGAMERIDVGICLDTGHAFLSGDLYHVVHKLSGHLRMIHASDNHGGRDDHLPPGDGKIGWERLLRQLDRSHFRGAMILEIAGGHDPAEVLAGARRGRAFLRDHGRRSTAFGAGPL
jgi:sugar phosphate isomerase/epimerase